MSTHDSITRRGSRRTWGARWRLAWRSLCAVVSRRPVAGGSVRAGRRERRRLSAIERALAAETPRLASMFEMFGQLAVGESHDGAERLTAPAWPRPRPRRAHLAVLLALASMVALCVTLSLRVHTVPRACPGSAAAPATAYAPVRELGCPAYATNK
jgi:hypothetical protein